MIIVALGKFARTTTIIIIPQQNSSLQIKNHYTNSSDTLKLCMQLRLELRFSALLLLKLEKTQVCMFLGLTTSGFHLHMQWVMALLLSQLLQLSLADTDMAQAIELIAAVLY